MEKVNTLEFEMFDPVEAGEEWAVTWGAPYKVVEVLIDGRKLLDIIREIEVPYAQEEGHPDMAGNYGHVDPLGLYTDLCNATQIPDADYDPWSGVLLFCCRDCGELFCWSVSMRVREDDQYVYWEDFNHLHRGWEYSLSFKFDKEDYEEALWDLWDLTKNQARD